MSAGAAVAPEAPTTELERHLRAARDAGRKLLVPYVTGGLTPDWLDLVEAVAAAGADAIEIGIPFSDPALDGATIQEASARALAGGATPAGILSDLATRPVGVPLVAMTSYNLVFRAGHHRFAGELHDAGVGGAILPDLPLDAAGDWMAEADAVGVANVLLVAPVTRDARLRRIVAASRGFVYGVSLMGTTGERSQLARSATEVGSRIKAVTDKPVLIGFGVSTPAHAVTAAAQADGVIVASALMRRVLDGDPVERAAALVAHMRRALDGEGPDDG